jgi:aspartate/methionine/tyrosine aminotransferase
MEQSERDNVSKRARAIPPFLAMDVLDQARRLEAEGRDIVHLELGEPDFPTPDNVLQAAVKAVKDGYTSYTPTQGILELREVISDFYKEEYGIEVHPDRVIVTMGSSPGMLLVFGALLNPGEEVIIPNPHYPPYPANISFIGGVPVKIDLDESAGFKYDTDRIRGRITSNTRGVIINSPSNPTGMMQDETVHRQLAAIAEDTGTYVISDEIYHGLNYGAEKTHTMLEFTDRAFVMSGFSKRWAMTGWRLGWIVAPEDFIGPMKNLHMNYFLSAAGFVQVAGVEALRNCDEAVEKMRGTYEQRRDYLLKEFRRIGFEFEVEPQGAFYLLINFKHISNDSLELAKRLLNEAGIACTPGLDFGEKAEGYIRICYAASMSALEEAVSRLEKWINDKT